MHNLDVYLESFRNLFYYLSNFKLKNVLLLIAQRFAFDSFIYTSESMMALKVALGRMAVSTFFWSNL